jgi:urea carboxylase
MPDAPPLPFTAVLVANRGEVAVRLIRGVRALGLRAVAVYTPADAAAAHVALADAAVLVPGYTHVDALLAAAAAEACGAVLPGYGFVSESEAAVRAFEAAGVAWAGPTAGCIEMFGGKVRARRVAEAAGVPCVPGSGVVSCVDEAVAAAAAVGFPALLKASAGGGGMGQAVVRDARGVARLFDGVVKQAEALFGSGDVYVERYVERGRHVEVQVFGDGAGAVVALGDRDCSVQRRRQKVVEEGPAPQLPGALRRALRDAAVRLCAAHRYRSAGTVEFFIDVDRGDWFFLEVNTRLQVEHGVTELVAGVDIVRWMVLLAGGVVPEMTAFRERGCAVEARVYAENPVRDYAPCPGRLSAMRWPAEGAVEGGDGAVVRVDAWARTGTEVTGLYDPLLGKVLCWGRTRAIAVEGLRRALEATVVRGVETNVGLLLQVCGNAKFLRGDYTTGLLGEFAAESASVEVVAPGLQSSVQDWPGRVGYWDVGVSPSGAMDAYAMGMANALVGNGAGAAALEITVLGPTLRFHRRALVALTGAALEADVDDGRPVAWWTPFWVGAGAVLTLGGCAGAGGRMAYLAVRGGFDAPKYLGSASTFPTGGFGGVTGAFLKAGDFLPLAAPPPRSSTASCWPVGTPLPAWLTPAYGPPAGTVVGAINGPHGSDDFLTPASLAEIWSEPYTVHHAANRLGVRLVGPTPKWARADGGSAGLHPSNLHDYTYAPGAVNFSGNTPIVLMLDGPSLGGFVCPITVSTAELWKVAQARPGTTLRFKQVPCDASLAAASATRAAWDAVRVADLAGLDLLAAEWTPDWAAAVGAVDLPAVAAALDPAAGDAAEVKVAYRMSGDEHVLIEYGEIELDLACRMRVHMLMEELRPRPYVRELCPGVRSLLVKYDPAAMGVRDLLAELRRLELGVLGSVDDVVVPSRVIRLPMAFDDRWSAAAQARYMRSVRPDAPYMPSNVEFVRRINGLASVDDVKRILSEAEYCVVGLGDVYLGAPCAVPVDPRHRLVTSKYNPARTYTPEGAVGIGGAYMCIYGMDSPGGYQLVARTIPIWDTHGQIPVERRGAPPHVPWLLRFFDRIRFYPVTDGELEVLRERYRRGALTLDITDSTFSFREYAAFCGRNAASIADFKRHQERSFVEERARWEASGEGENSAAAGKGKAAAAAAAGAAAASAARPPFSVSVLAGVSATVWSVTAADGDVVERGQPLVVLESMKVEISVEAPVAGTVRRLAVAKGDPVAADREICLVVSSRGQAMRDLSAGQLRSMYKLGALHPSLVVNSLLPAAAAAAGVFVWTAEPDACSARLADLSERRKTDHLPLYGVPFSVGANVDVASAAIVGTLEGAGAILLGKTSMDIFGVDVTGTQLQHDVPENPGAPGRISGGACGAAIAVSASLVTFSVHVDCAGSAIASPGLVGGNVLGLRVTEGLLSLAGVAPTCPPLESVFICATDAADLRSVLDVCVAGRPASAVAGADNSLRRLPASADRPPLRAFSAGVLSPQHLVFPNDSAGAAAAYHAAVLKLCQLGGAAVEVDFAPFADTVAMFDTVPLDSARYGALADRVRGDRAVPPAAASAVLRSEDTSACKLSAGLEALRQNKRTAEHRVWSAVDVLVVPTVAAAPTVDAALADLPAATEAVTKFTRFVAPMDLCSLTLGCITLVAPAFHDADLLAIAAKWTAS